jgi:flagellar basal body-associated protein FliL
MFKFIKRLRNIENIEVYDPKTGRKVSNWWVVVAGLIFIFCLILLVVSFISMTREIGCHLKKKSEEKKSHPYSLTISPRPTCSFLSNFKEGAIFFIVDSHLKTSAKDNETSNDVQDKTKIVHCLTPNDRHKARRLFAVALNALVVLFSSF